MQPDVSGAARVPQVLVVVAHPDDETFGCGSLLLHVASLGARTTVVCATRGEAGESALSEIGPGQLGDLRERELHDAARILGVSRVELLDYVDSGMDGPAGAVTLVGAPFDSVRDRIRDIVEDVGPDVVVTLDAGDGHRDHARIRDATIAAVAMADSPMPRVYLQCLPQSLMRAWLDHVGAAQPNSGHLRVVVPGTPDEDITTVIDTRKHLPARRLAMAAHRSQSSPYAGLPDDLAEVVPDP